MIESLAAISALAVAGLTAIKTLALCARGSRPATRPSTSTAPAGVTYTVYAETGYEGTDNRYVFTLKQLSTGYRCYINRTPSYRNRSTTMGDTHYLTDSCGKYICYTAKISHLEQAKTLCHQWSNLTQRYIETGRKFES